jgi:hypothetical protein
MNYTSVVAMPGPSVAPRESRAEGGVRPFSTRTQSFEIVDEQAGIRLRPGHYAYGGGFSPRHHHNFDQIRFTVTGNVVYGRKSYGPGTCGYFPESVFYGATKFDDTTARDVVLQFPGPSAAPFFSTDESRRGTAELQAQGVRFENGAAHYPDGHNQDGFEAVWEHLAGRKIEYAPARYDDPVRVMSQSFPWLSTGAPGVTSKHLGYFNEGGPNVHLVHLEPGARTAKGALDCAQIRFVVDGELEYAGTTCPSVSCLYYPPGASYEGLESRSGATVLVIQMKAPRGEAPPLSVV